QRRLTIAVSNGSLSVGPISVTGVTGVLVVLPSEATAAGGLAGSLSASINLGGLVGGVTFAGTFGVAVNQTARAINERVTVGGTATTLSLDAGSYVRISGTGVTLTVLGQRLSGDFFFEQARKPGPDETLGTADDERVVRLGGKNITLFLGDDRGTQATSDDVGLLVQQTLGQDAKFLVTDAGLAGEVAATVSLRGIPTSNVTIGDLSMRLEINNTTRAANATITGLTNPLVLPARPYARVEVGTPAVPISLT